jgi:hypothetical protein
MNREPYWDYMGRRLREETKLISRDDMWKREIAEMQKQVHLLQMRVVNLNYIVDDLEYKVKILGGEPKQLELKI